MSVVDPRSFAFQSELVFALQSMLSSSRITGEVVPSVILIQFGEGKGAPRFRPLSWLVVACWDWRKRASPAPKKKLGTDSGGANAPRTTPEHSPLFPEPRTPEHKFLGEPVSGGTDSPADDSDP